MMYINTCIWADRTNKHGQYAILMTLHMWLLWQFLPRSETLLVTLARI